MAELEAAADFLDCELSLLGSDRAELRIAGGHPYEGQPRLTPELQQELLRHELDPKEYGKQLFEAVLVSDLLTGYREAHAAARHAEKKLRFRLRISGEAPELHELNWELLYDAERELALGRSQRVAFPRYLSVPGIRPRHPESRPRLLVVIAAPEDLEEYGLPQLDKPQLRREVEGALRDLLPVVRCDFLEDPVTPQRIRERLTNGEYQVLHLLAHGTLSQRAEPDAQTAGVLLETDERAAVAVDEEWFSEIFEANPSLLLVTLVACHSGRNSRPDPFSGLGAALVKRQIPAVVAMRRSISLRAARLFTKFFYTSLARDGYADLAINEARHQLFLVDPESPEWGTPALFMGAQEGRLWKATAWPSALAPQASDDSEFPWSALLDCIQSDAVVPVVGPDVLKGLLPRPEEIAQRWATEWDYPLDGFSRASLPAVAQFVEIAEAESFPHGRLATDLKRGLLHNLENGLIGELSAERWEALKSLSLNDLIGEVVPELDRDTDPHLILAGLPLSTYLTTNYDRLLTAAIERERRGTKPRDEGETRQGPQRTHCAWRRTAYSAPDPETLKITPQEPLIYHLYGHTDVELEQVLTEDNYLDFLKAIAVDLESTTATSDPRADRQILIPPTLRRKLTQSLLLFLGYRVRDLECRVLFRGLIGSLSKPYRPRLALVQLDPEEKSTNRDAEVQHFLRQWCGTSVNVGAYWISVHDFLRELRARWRKAHDDA